MAYQDLQISKYKSSKRVGRGISAGGGKTAGRGTKGQNSRTGGGVRPGFEGGQTPMMKRIPKLHGFTSHRVAPEVVYTGQLNQFAGKTADNATLAAAGLVSTPYVRAKLVSNGELKAKVTVKLQAASGSAAEAVKKAGGSFEVVAQVGRVAAVKADKTKKQQ